MRVIVTGSSGALGRAVVGALVARDDAVIGIDRVSHDALPPSVSQLLCNDLTDEAMSQEAIAAAVDHLGGVDALVLLAGGFAWAKVEDSDAAFWCKLFSDNLETTLVPLRAALPSLREGASILCVGANSAEPADAGMAAYAASKSAIARLVEALAIELKPRRIRVNAVLPAVIDTPANRAAMADVDPSSWTSPEAIADVITFLISTGARAINGALVPVTNNG